MASSVLSSKESEFLKEGVISLMPHLALQAETNDHFLKFAVPWDRSSVLRQQQLTQDKET
jgi:hypothetical protein